MIERSWTRESPDGEDEYNGPLFLFSFHRPINPVKPLNLPLQGISLAILAALVVGSPAAAGEPTALRPKTAQSQPQEKWVLRTDDTRLAVGVSSDQKLCIYELSGPDGWNWTTVPSVLPLA